MFCFVAVLSLLAAVALAARYEPSWYTFPDGYYGVEYDPPAIEAPVVIAPWTTGYVGWDPHLLLDDDTNTVYATSGHYPVFTNTFDFSYYSNATQRIAGFAHMQRNEDTGVTNSTLVFSNTNDFSVIVATRTFDNIEGKRAVTTATFEGVDARYCRWIARVRFQAWAGGSEIVFMDGNPPPPAGTMILLR